MIRRSIGGAILGFALFVGSFAWSGFVALQTVFDPDRSREVAEELLDNDEVRSQLAENLSGAIASLIPLEVPVEEGVVEDVTAEILNDPAVEQAILAAFADTHAAFLGEGDVPGRVDLSAVAVAARERLVTAAPQLDTVVPDAPPLTLELPTDRVPDASPIRSFLRAAVPVLTIVAAAGAILALFATNDRPSILRRAGAWALTTTAAYLILGLGVPYALRQFAPDQAEVIAALLSALLRSLLVPSIALGLAGLALLGISALWSGAAASRGSARRAPDPDAAHRRPATDDRHRRSAAPGARPPASSDPYGRPAGQAPATYGPPPGAPTRHGQPGQPMPQSSPPVHAQGAPAPQGRPVQAMPQAPPVHAPGAPAPPGQPVQPVGPGVQPTQPVAQHGGVPSGSPYPDAAHHRETHHGHEQGQPPTADQWAHQPDARPGGQPATPSSSVFADVPPPTDTAAPPFAAPAPGAAEAAPPGSVEPGRSVFDPPTPQTPAPAVPPQPQAAPQTEPQPQAPPVGARWDPAHGWILDPNSPGPLPEGATWVNGVGFVLPDTRRG